MSDAVRPAAGHLVAPGFAIAELPVAVATTGGADHTVTRLNPALHGLLPALVVGEPVPDTERRLRAAMDRTLARQQRTTAEAADPRVIVECVPIPGGVLVHALQTKDRTREDRATGAALQDLVGELLAAATPAAIGRLVATAAADLLGADAASVYARADARTLTALHSAGWPPEVARGYERIELHRGRPLSDAVLDREPVWIEDSAQWRLRFPEMAPAGTAGGVQATACLPLRVEDRDLGAAVFSFFEPRVFSPDERDFLVAVTALCAQALDRARLHVAEQAALARAERERDRMTFLARTARLMEAPLEVERRLQRLAELVTTEVADWCAVHLVRGGQVERVAVAHHDPAKVAFVAELQRRYPPDPDAPGGAIQVSRTGVSAHFPEVADDLLVAAAVDDEHLALLRSIGMRSAVVVPLVVRGRSLGAMTLVQVESGHRFDRVDLAFVEQVAAAAAVALDNARLYEHQRRTAQTLQAALLPSALPRVPGLRLAARYQAQNADGSDVHVGGDLYDVIPAGAPDRWAFVVADVCGKGAEAAAVTALIRHTVRAEVGHGLGPVEVLHRLNQAMRRETIGGAGRFATAVHGRLELGPRGARVRLVAAGHPPPLVRRGGTVAPVGAAGTLLGVYPDVTLTEVTVDLDRGDMLVLYTDGVTEARGVDGFYGTERLAATVTAPQDATADTVAEALLTDVVDFQRGKLRDDVAILVIEAAGDEAAGVEAAR